MPHRPIVDANGTPIPKRTTYHGVTFRSQLESKFARYLHGLWEMWVYEPRVFGPKGRRYLPDFELEGKPQPTYIEVKPTLWQVPIAQEKMTVIWETHPDALLIVACAEGSFWSASIARGPWESWVARWPSR